MRRKRRRTEEPLANPVSLNFDIPRKYQYIVLYDSGPEDPRSILALGHTDLVPFLGGDLLFGDGTFDVTPLMFFQLCTVLCQVGASFPPCVYFLLPNKTEETYSGMFNILKIIAPFVFPQKVLVDFEQAAANAYTSAFPQAHIKGCFFHSSQSILRKVSSLGLKQSY